MPPLPSGLVSISFEVEGEQIIDRALSRFGEGVQDFSPAFQEMRDLVYSLEADQFATEGGHSGGWQPLAESTLKRKPPGLPILVLTSRLRDSLVSPGGENISTITPLEFHFGTMVGYGIYHQSIAPRSRLPRRPVIAFEDADKQEYVKLMQRYLVRLRDDAAREMRASTSMANAALDILTGGPG